MVHVELMAPVNAHSMLGTLATIVVSRHAPVGLIHAVTKETVTKQLEYAHVTLGIEAGRARTWIAQEIQIAVV